MKAFGIRFTAGLATILFGFYAAALAQKDKQNNDESWSVEAPRLTQPADPIASLPKEPETTSATPGQSLAALAAGAFATPDANEPSEITLVQHTEEVAPEQHEPAADASPSFAPPGSLLGTPSAASAPSQPVDPQAADWMNPPADRPAEPMPMVTAGSLSMSFPTEDTVDPPAPEPSRSTAVDPAPSNALRAPGFGDNALRMSSPDAAPGATEPSPDQPVMQLPTFGADTANGFVSGDLQNAPHPDTMAPPVRNDAATFDAAPQSFAGTVAGAGSPAHSPSSSQPTLRLPAGNLSAEPVVDTIAAPGPGAPAAQESPYLGQSHPPAELGAPINRHPSHRADDRAIPNSPPQRFAALGQIGARGDGPPANLPQLAPGVAPNLSQVDPNSVIGSPGDRRLEGAQSPSIVIHKRAPAEVQVGKPASFVIQVQNVGGAEALGVVVHDRVPAGMRLVDASPEPVMQGDLLMWQLGGMSVGEERTVTMKLVPETEGELGSVARVTFEAAASVRTISTRPELKIVQRGPSKVTIGQQVEIDLEVSNLGTGDATGVSLQEDVPEGLEHPRGRQLDNLMGTLASGEVRHQVLRLRATQPGVIQNTIRLVSEDGLTASHTIDIEVVAPELEVELKGPSRRFLERQATYQVNVINTGTADATNVEFVVGLDRGFRFVSTDYQGAYDQSRHAVVWSLERLPAGVPATVPLTLLPVEEGSRVLTIDARADLGTVARTERQVTVEGFAELSFQILNPGGPIEMGAESTYEITVNNSGSKADSNVQVAVQFPQGLELISADGPNGRGSTDGRGQVVFPPLGQLAQGQTATYRLRVRGVAPGTHLVKAIVMSDAATVPVTKEESTLVYADQ